MLTLILKLSEARHFHLYFISHLDSHSPVLLNPSASLSVFLKYSVGRILLPDLYPDQAEWNTYILETIYMYGVSDKW